MFHVFLVRVLSKLEIHFFLPSKGTLRNSSSIHKSYFETSFHDNFLKIESAGSFQSIKLLIFQRNSNSYDNVSGNKLGLAPTAPKESLNDTRYFRHQLLSSHRKRTQFLTTRKRSPVSKLPGLIK
jgi:hypothetical protein